jgi:methionyl-tRNA synthetase
MGHEHEAFPTDRPAVVTCGLPYANGDLHIGHLRTYVGGDAYARALRKLGQRTAFVSGSDMHGTPVAVNAEQEGVTPEEFALRWHERYEETFPRFGVEFDNYGHTHDETNVALTREIVRALIDADLVYEREIMVAYDPVGDRYLPDRYVEGTCPYCGEHARGDECDEGCGRHLEPGEIESPTSTLTGNPAEYRERSHRFFRVSELQEYLQGFIDRLEGTENARNQPREWIEGELRDWCITRDMDWGIDYPDDDGDDADDLVLYVWVDAPIEYVASTRQYSERVGADSFDWERAWREDGEIVHVIGRDIIQHHTVFWPAMLHGAGYVEPRAVMASGFITLEGRGFSTSRDRAVWADEYLDEGFHPDPLRHYLVTTGGFQGDVDFSWAKFRDRTNGELVGTVGNFLYRSLLFAHRNYGGTPDAELSPEVRERIETAIDEFRAGVNEYSVRAVGEAAVSLARYGNEYIQRHEPWNLVDDEPERAATVIRDCVQLAKAVTVLFEPIAPGRTAAVWDRLRESTPLDAVGVEAALEPPAGTFDEPVEPFETVEDDHVEALTAELEERVAAATEEGVATATEEGVAAATEEGVAAATEADDATAATDGEGEAGPDLDLPPLVEERVSLEQFQALDLRVGRIVAAEGIEGADDLARLEVDVGHETRQVVAGIKRLHDLSALPGRTVVVLVNVERAELFGVESNGMVLAAGEAADLLTTHDDAVPGERIR